MKPPFALTLVGIGGIAILVLLQNLLGSELNTLFLKMPGIDKVLHITEYLLIVVCVHALAGRSTRNETARVRLAVGAAILIAILDESIQRLVVSRSVEAFDLVANSAGVLLGWTVVARPRRLAAAAAATVALAAGGYVAWDTRSRLADYNRGLELARQHDFAGAHEQFRRAFERGLRTPGLFNELAWTQVESGAGNPADAVDHARRALEMRPDSADILDTYGWALHAAGRHAEALEALLQAYRRKPDMFCIHYHLGAVYLSLGRSAEAADHLRRQMALPHRREAVLASQALAVMEGGRPVTGTGGRTEER